MTPPRADDTLEPLEPEEHEDDTRAFEERSYGWQLNQDNYERWLTSLWER